MSRRWIAAMAAVVLMGVVGLAVVMGGTAASAPPSRAFVRVIDNKFFPLKPGTVFVYHGVSDGEIQIDRVTVTHRTKKIQGVVTRVVRDVLRHNGHVIEKTHDWYAQDVQGNVWYYGEDTAEYGPSGNVISRAGSWKAGVLGAVAGIIMKAHPSPAAGYRQEYWKGHAEDQAWILRRGGTIKVPYGNLDRALSTMEWTPLEAGVVDKKFYAAGVGLVVEHTVAGGQENVVLVRIIRP